MFAVVFRILLRAAFTLLLLTACVFFGLHSDLSELLIAGRSAWNQDVHPTVPVHSQPTWRLSKEGRRG